MLSGKFSFKTYSFEIFGWFIKKHFFRSLKYSKNDLDSSFLLIWFRTHPKICTFCHNCLVLVFQFFVGKGVRLTYKRERSRSPAWLPSRVSVSHFHLAAGPLNQAALYYPGAQLTQGSNLTLCSQTTPPPNSPHWVWCRRSMPPSFPLSRISMSLQGLLGIPLHYLSRSTSPFNSHCTHTPAASSLDDYNSLLTNRLLVSPPPIHCCHSNLPKTPFNHAKPLIKNLHYLFITTRIKSKRLSFLPLSGLNPHFQFIAHSFPTVFVDSTKTCLVTPSIHLEWFFQPLTGICVHSLRPMSNSSASCEAFPQATASSSEFLGQRPVSSLSWIIIQLLKCLCFLSTWTTCVLRSGTALDTCLYLPLIIITTISHCPLSPINTIYDMIWL